MNQEKIAIDVMREQKAILPVIVKLSAFSLVT